MKDVPDDPAYEFIENRTREEAQLDRLRDCLAWRSWDSGLAVMILAGIVPNKYRIPDWESLPGYPGRKGMSEYEMGEYLDDRLTHVGRFIGGDPRPPIEWLRMARKNGFSPEWLSFALGDETCRPFLPPELIDTPERPPDRMKRAQIRKALARNEQNVVWRSIEQYGHDLFSAWWEEEPATRSTKEHLAEAIREEVLKSVSLPAGAKAAEQVSVATIKSHIRTWIIEVVGRGLFRAWLQDPARCSVLELAETVRQAISGHVRDNREVPGAKSIVRHIEQWQARDGRKGS